METVPRYLCSGRRKRMKLVIITAMLCLYMYNAVQTPGEYVDAFKRGLLPDNQDLNDALVDRLYAIKQKFPEGDYSDFNSFNASLSNTIDIFRNISDVRHPDCRNVHYDTSTLPSASVIISFHNEIWSVILRTINSVLMRTPPRLLKEIILVDDCSTLPYLNTTLLEYVAAAPKTKLIRNAKKSGLMKTRMNGARAATGEVLIFLDAHIEVSPHWIEPLLNEIKKDPLILAIPQAEILHMDTLKYTQQGISTGGFDWSFEYVWWPVPDRLAAILKPSDPVPSPSNIGCAIAVDRHVFFQYGAFDEGMDIWGGENTEISFRFWMCAHGIRILPCSRVGHLYRRSFPYASNVERFEKNYQRAVDIWMGPYAKFYYAAEHRRVAFTPEETTSFEERKKFIESLNCKSFDWYLSEIIPDMFIPWTNSTFQGRMSNVAGGCLTVIPNKTTMKMEACTDIKPLQHFYYLQDHRLFHNATHCVVNKNSLLELHACATNASGEVLLQQSWDFRFVPQKSLNMTFRFPDHIIQMNPMDDNDMCVSQTYGSAGLSASLLPCKFDRFQTWEFTYRMDFSPVQIISAQT